MKLIIEGLHHVPEPSGTRIVHFSDLHLGKGREPDEFVLFKKLLEAALETSPDVIVVTGDLAHIPDDIVSLEWVRDALDATGVPWVVVPGNHDIEHPDRPDVFASIFGEFPRYETHAGVGFALFDSFCGLAADDREPEEWERYQENGHFAHGAIGTEQYEALVSDLNNPWIAVLHHHLYEDPDDDENEGAMRPLFGVEALLSWSKSHGASAIFHGHKHAYSRVVIEGDLPVFRGGATTKLPAVFRIIDIDDEREWFEVEVRIAES